MVVFSQELEDNFSVHNMKSPFPTDFSYGLHTNNQCLQSPEILGNTTFETSICNRGLSSKLAPVQWKRGVDQKYNLYLTTWDGWAFVKG